MKHVVGRHVIVDIMEGATGALIVAAISQKMWWLLAVSALLGGCAIMLDKFNIDDEENSQNKNDKQN